MKTLKRGRYNTMNSWNDGTAPAYNLKVYNVINYDLQDKVFELMESDDFYDVINSLIRDFDLSNDYQWQAGFNGRSGGYLVLYKGGKKLSDYKSICQSCGQKNFTSIKENNNICGKCGKAARVNQEMFTIYTKPGLTINDQDVPVDVLKSFRRLVVDIVKEVEFLAKNSKIEEEEYTITKTRKVIV